MGILEKLAVASFYTAITLLLHYYNPVACIAFLAWTIAMEHK